MNHSSGALTRHSVLCASVAAIAMLGLAGCVPSAATKPSVTPTASPSASTASALPSPSSSATSTSPTPTPTIPLKSVSIACGTLVPPQVVYDFNPNFSLVSGFTPAAGTAAAVAVADKGIACNWVNQTSRATFTVSVARPGAKEFATLKEKAASGTATSGYGDAAYFSKNAEDGRIDVFSGSYWLVATSSYFGSTLDASGILKAAISASK